MTIKAELDDEINFDIFIFHPIKTVSFQCIPDFGLCFKKWTRIMQDMWVLESTNMSGNSCINMLWNYSRNAETFWIFQQSVCSRAWRKCHILLKNQLDESFEIVEYHRLKFNEILSSRSKHIWHNIQSRQNSLILVFWFSVAMGKIYICNTCL